MGTSIGAKRTAWCLARASAGSADRQVSTTSAVLAQRKGLEVVVV
jgi:hypothetical protein